ncbi:MAG: hypothetical protein JNK23_24285 [Opitutaceae bacterium]|nr:hypothetical protein [Opitutaceae bacterium]
MAFLTLASVCLATMPGPWVAGNGQFRNELYEVWVDPMDNRGPRWNAEKDTWPVSITRAISLARESLAKFVGDDQRHYDCMEAKLCRFYSPSNADKATWYFLIVFESSHESQITRTPNSGGYAPAILPFVVFGDERVTLPQKKVRRDVLETDSKPVAAPPERRP